MILLCSTKLFQVILIFKESFLTSFTRDYDYTQNNYNFLKCTKCIIYQIKY